MSSMLSPARRGFHRAGPERGRGASRMAAALRPRTLVTAPAAAYRPRRRGRPMTTASEQLKLPASLGASRGGPLELAGSRRQHVVGAAWFVALSLGLAAVGALMTPRAPALVPYVLALGPGVAAAALAWREGHGAL